MTLVDKAEPDFTFLTRRLEEHEQRRGQGEVLHEINLVSHALARVGVGPEVMEEKGRKDEESNETGDRPGDVLLEQDTEATKDEDKAGEDHRELRSREALHFGISHHPLEFHEMTGSRDDEIQAQDNLADKVNGFHRGDVKG